MSHQSKSIIRKQILEKRKTISLSLLSSNSDAVFNHLLGLPIFQNSQNIALYYASSGEVETQQIIDYCWQQQKHCYLPKTRQNHQMDFVEFTSQDKLIVNQYGIPEPEKNHIIPLEKLDIILVPMVAFDAHCHRLGMGAGYYDRYLSASKHLPFLIGLAHDFQKVSNITHSHWDIDMDLIITNLDIHRPLK